MKHFMLLCSLLMSLSTMAQNRFTVSGTVTDATSSEQMIGAAVIDPASGAGVVTNTYGFYSLTLPVGQVTLRFSYVGYGRRDTTINLNRDMRLDLGLYPGRELQTVEISAEKAEKIEERVQMSQITVPIEHIKRIPALMGEVDVLKVLQLLPGVQAGGEGQNGLYVRGGSPDQNLILLDGVPVYNVSHLLGFFSVFNADALKNVTLTKGGFPARYGGRLSSVIDISMKEGNMQKWQGVASAGVVASRLTLEGPIVKDKVSMIVSGRRTYVDILASPLIAASSRQEGIQANLRLYFYDLNSKINWRINDKHRVYLSGYFGDDVFRLQSREEFANEIFQTNNGTQWGNATLAARWNWLLSPKTFSNVTLTRSRYSFDFLTELIEGQKNQLDTFSAVYKSGIVDHGVRWDIDHVLSPKHYIRTGVGMTRHVYNPGALQLRIPFDEVSFDTLLGNAKTQGFEGFAYVEDDINFGFLRANIGVHATGFWVDSVFYPSVQPRIGINVPISRGWAAKASFATMAQFINLLTNESLGLPTDLWVPSTARIKPQQAWQVAAGVAHTIGEDYELSIEGFYKDMRNVISYKEGATFIVLDNDWQSRVTQGRGWVYGAELFLQKKSGKTTGWIGYTWARNWRQFEDINGGLKFPFKYDRRHDFKFVIMHELSKDIVLSGTWVYGTGNAITLPQYRYQLPEVGSMMSSYTYLSDISIPGQRNANRMAPYHRADLSIEFNKQRKHYARKWILGAYNAYSRANPYFVYTRNRQVPGSDEERLEFRQVALFPIIPSIALEIKF
jgi:hypothetical protein